MNDGTEEAAEPSTEDVRALYEAHPYPSPIVSDSLIYDLATGLEFLFQKGGLDGAQVLDAGCGSGHRLLGAAKRFPKAEFIGVDISNASLDTAMRLAEEHGIENVRFEQADLLNLSLGGRFDAIISTGVIHHLEDPARGLRVVSDHLASDGVFMVWHYHALGEHQRLLQRELFLMLQGGIKPPSAEGVSLLRDLGLSLSATQYGSGSAQAKAEHQSQLSLDLDAYAHPIVNAYRFEEAIALFDDCDVDWVAVNGITMRDASKLLDLEEVDDSPYRIANLSPRDLFDEESLQARYRALNKPDQLRLIELRLQPSGFTILAGRGASLDRLRPRVAGNRHD